jgi:hydrogenase maturation protease HycI
MRNSLRPERAKSLARRDDDATQPGSVQPWRARLERELRSAGRLFVLGVGNRDRADDGAGSLCARLLERKIRDRRRASSIIQALDGGEAPENATGAIRRFRPTNVLIIDAAAGGHQPGSIFFISRKKIPDEDLSTHRLPLSRLARYLEESIGCRVLVVGIEPLDTAWGRPMSPAARRAAATLAESIAGVMGPAAPQSGSAGSRREAR